MHFHNSSQDYVYSIDYLSFDFIAIVVEPSSNIRFKIMLNFLSLTFNCLVKSNKPIMLPINLLWFNCNEIMKPQNNKYY